MTHQRSTPAIERASSSGVRVSKSQNRGGTSAILQRLENAPGSIRPADVLQLQRSIGNRATGLLLQAKLKLGPAGDRYEQEADRVAKQVVRASSQPAVQREEGEEGAVQTSRYASSMADYQRSATPIAAGISRVQRGFFARPQMPKVQRDEMEEDELQASPNHGMEGGDVDTDVARSIQSAKGGGQPLHDGVRSSMERGFGADFGGVRVHTGGQADALNRSLNAKAFTTGKDIFFGKGQYNPGSTGGQELIAHELTHTVQQGAAGVQRDVIQRRVTDINWATATQAKPSALGVKGGVFFITVNGTMHVVKASENVGATKFAEQLLAMLGGNTIATTDSTAVPMGDDEHTAILTALDRLKPQQPQQIEGNEEANAKYQAYMQKYQAFQNSSYFMIQQNMFTPGTEVLGTEDLTIALAQAGENKAGLQNRVDQDVQTQAALLLNQAMMQGVGRLLAIDTLFGNADRFEAMNVQNAFMRGDNTIAAIDTEAIMQSLSDTTQFRTSEVGTNLVEEGNTDVERYVNFVLGSGREISDEAIGAAPSSNVAKFMTNFDHWFRTVFLRKYLYFQQDPMVTNRFIQLGFPDNVNQGNWPTVKGHIKTGFDAGVTAIETAMNGPQYNQIKQNYSNLANTYGENANFDWDAFRVRGEYMAAIKNGLSNENARQAIIDRMTLRENTRQNAVIDPKVTRVIHFGTTNNILDQRQAQKIGNILQEVLPRDQNDILHISSRVKFAQSVIASRGKNQALDSRLEAARAYQLKNLLLYTISREVDQAVSQSKMDAKALENSDIDQVRYLTRSGLQTAQNALNRLYPGFVAQWGPN